MIIKNKVLASNANSNYSFIFIKTINRDIAYFLNPCLFKTIFCNDRELFFSVFLYFLKVLSLYLNTFLLLRLTLASGNLAQLVFQNQLTSE